MSRRHSLSILAALAVAATVVACTQGGGGSGDRAATVAADTEDLSTFDVAFDFDETAVLGDVVPTAVPRGRLPVDAQVVTESGGTLTWAAGHQGGRALRTPAYTSSGPVHAAALVIWPTASSIQELDPLTHAVTIRADFRIDRAVEGRPRDDGDNLVQRGRFGDTSQIKLQIDHGVPSCRIEGTAGEVVVSASDPVPEGRWHRITCIRADGEVRLSLLDLETPDAEAEHWARDDDPGSLSFGNTPLSVGAKVNELGMIDTTSIDQFHGLIDQVVFDVGR